MMTTDKEIMILIDCHIVQRFRFLYDQVFRSNTKRIQFLVTP